MRGITSTGGPNGARFPNLERVIARKVSSLGEGNNCLLSKVHSLAQPNLGIENELRYVPILNCPCPCMYFYTLL